MGDGCWSKGLTGVSTTYTALTPVQLMKDFNSWLAVGSSSSSNTQQEHNQAWLTGPYVDESAFLHYKNMETFFFSWLLQNEIFKLCCKASHLSSSCPSQATPKYPQPLINSFYRDMHTSSWVKHHSGKMWLPLSLSKKKKKKHQEATESDFTVFLWSIIIY